MNVEDYRYKTELHLHTSPASSCSEVSPERAAFLYANLGYHSIVVSNHFDPNIRFREDKKRCIETYLADYREALKYGIKYGLNVILGCEIRFTENNNDYLLFGIDESTLDLVYDSLELGIEHFSKMFRSEESLLIQAHPFRNHMTQVAPEYLDGIEAFNMHPHHNSRVSLANRYAKEHRMMTTVGTDFHHPGHEGLSALLTKTELKTSKEIVDVLRSGDYLFEIGGSIVLP